MNRTALSIRPWREQEVKGPEHKAEVHRTVPAFHLNFVEPSESVKAILKAITEKDSFERHLWRLQDILPESRKPLSRFNQSHAAIQSKQTAVCLTGGSRLILTNIWELRGFRSGRSACETPPQSEGSSHLWVPRLLTLPPQQRAVRPITAHLDRCR